MNSSVKRRAGLALAGLVLVACGNSAPPETKEIASYRAKDLVIALSNEKGDLMQGQNRFVIAFRSAANNQPVDAGTVSVSSSMSMPGMAPMTAAIELEPAGKTGEYLVKGEFGMSGQWRFEVRWSGPAGEGATTFSTSVR